MGNKHTSRIELGQSEIYNELDSNASHLDLLEEESVNFKTGAGNLISI